MKKHPILYLQGFKEQFDETFIFVRSLAENKQFSFFILSFALFFASFFFIYLGFTDKSNSLQIFYFTVGVLLFFFALIFIVIAYSDKFPELNTGKVLNTTVRNINANEESNVFDVEFLEKLFTVIEKHSIYGKHKERFGLQGYRFKSKTQLAVLLNLIMFDSHSKKFSNVNQKVFLKSFKEHFKKHYCLNDQQFKEEIDFSDAYFSSNIKINLFKFDKMNIRKIIGLNNQSEYFELYNEFSKILIAENIS
ncbi:hypothetical protein IRZ71_15865 [Flavobacterium sp. ANB]|uniref:hypothetical protein n=1 Tax=unclassified Flavobacterium TaxID=196869 RepID=UPI0012B6C5DB|nr:MULTISPECIES: hypothetical protein [unclassified Flavobacterium]MBF4517842.1 hypothetical protein [Flavobacterium sp. ANB]MTD72088.1 hypothetical protein [Flavobacterium sp. LC2016-13]